MDGRHSAPPPAAHPTHLHKLHLRLRLPQLPHCSLPPCWTPHCRPQKPRLLPQSLHCLLSFPLCFHSLFLLAKPAGLPAPKQHLLTCHQELQLTWESRFLLSEKCATKLELEKWRMSHRECCRGFNPRTLLESETHKLFRAALHLRYPCQEIHFLQTQTSAIHVSALSQTLRCCLQDPEGK